jgi:hypothetical protein
VSIAPVQADPVLPHWQVLLTQRSAFPLQTVLQLPQWFGSVAVLKQAPLQLV